MPAENSPQNSHPVECRCICQKEKKCYFLLTKWSSAGINVLQKQNK
jgi:hypothetical protein